MRTVAILILTVSALVACEGYSQPESPQKSSNNRRTAERIPRPPATAIPEDVTFTVIKQDRYGDTKRSLDIRLNRKVPKDVLRTIALQLKDADSGRYERTFIVYYLPEMQVGAGGWATTHFNPNLEVRILGLTIEEEQQLTTESVATNRDIIGRWLDESPFIGSRITIFREDGKLYIEQIFKDGSGGKKELIEKQSPLGRRFDTVTGSSAGDHWLLDSRGSLQIRDNEGLIATAKKID